jgi:DNA polymerase III subunit delta'
MFKKILGQNKAISILTRAIENDKLANSYLFFGPDGVGKYTAALYFGMAINCHSKQEDMPCGICPSCKKFLSYTHPDFLFVFPSPKLDISVEGEIKSTKMLAEYEAYIENKINSPWKEYSFPGATGIQIGKIRMLEHRINLTPNEGKFKIYIVEDADQMNIKAANAFLKTLEEPPLDTIIILTTSRLNSLLPTIISRCQQVPFRAIPRYVIEQKFEEHDFSDEVEAKIYARIANGSMEKALCLAEEGKLQSRDQTIDLLKMVISGNDVGFIDVSMKFRSNKSQSSLTEIIAHLIIWISDISYFQNYPQEIVNMDKTDLLETLYQMNPAVDEYATEFISFLEEMLHRLEGHVNQQLISIEIYNRLTKIFQKK